MDKAAYFEQMRNRRRNEILTVAREMFLEHGVSEFSMQSLAKNLDISTVTLYKYFKNMDDIMQGLRTQIEGKLIELLFLQSVDRENDPLELFLWQMRMFYDVILKNREDITLLTLFEVHMRTEGSTNTNVERQISYVEKWNEKMIELLQSMKLQGIMKEKLEVEEVMQFITRMNTALIQHMGLLSDRRFQKEENIIKRQIGQLIELFSVYITQ